MARLTQYERSVIVGILAILVMGALVGYLRDRGRIQEDDGEGKGPLERVEGE